MILVNKFGIGLIFQFKYDFSLACGHLLWKFSCARGTSTHDVTIINTLQTRVAEHAGRFTAQGFSLLSVPSHSSSVRSHANCCDIPVEKKSHLKKRKNISNLGIFESKCNFILKPVLNAKQSTILLNSVCKLVLHLQNFTRKITESTGKFGTGTGFFYGKLAFFRGKNASAVKFYQRRIFRHDFGSCHFGFSK